ncbi:hypothetical protein ABGN05_20010 [Aquibium sp. LZ166]|uniref:Uncharacterized protein n=1 Tax=Aquibium pacificus TaxID=3153579 RepID=A0ABV3SMF6_9HYPH
MIKSMIRDGIGFVKLVRPLALYRAKRYMQTEELLRRRKIAGNYSIVAALLSASCHHHMGNVGYATALYEDIYIKASSQEFFNQDSTEFLRSYAVWAAERRIARRAFDLRRVNFVLRSMFALGDVEL